jgi:RNA 3'-terminal phosphate cyclase
MAAEKETVEPVAQEQTIHVHDASGDEHIQPKPIAIRTPAMVLEAMAKRVPERLEGEQATIPIVEKPLPTSSVELVAQDEAIAATSTAKSPTCEEEVASPTAEDVGDAAEKNDAQVGGNEASGMDVDLHTESPPRKCCKQRP